MNSLESSPAFEDADQKAENGHEKIPAHKFSEDPRFVELLTIWRKAVSPATDPESEKLLRSFEYAKKFAEENPDYKNYALYHVMSGSGPRFGENQLFDKEDHELENIIRSL